MQSDLCLKKKKSKQLLQQYLDQPNSELKNNNLKDDVVLPDVTVSSSADVPAGPHPSETSL